MSGAVGIWAPYRLLAADEGGEVAAELDDLGYRVIWIGNGPSMLDLAGRLLAATGRITVATGVLNLTRNPLAAGAAPASYARLSAAHPGRFLLGLGSGWAPGAGAYPYRNMVAYLDRLDSARAPVPAHGRILAALGPRMFALAATRSAGAHPFLTTPTRPRHARSPAPNSTSTSARPTTCTTCAGSGSPTAISWAVAVTGWSTRSSPGATPRP